MPFGIFKIPHLKTFSILKNLHLINKIYLCNMVIEVREMIIRNRKLIPGTYDKVFKKLFTSEDTKEFTITLISEITGLPYDVLERAEIQANELEIEGFNDKQSRVDLLIKVDKTYINIELNRKKYEGLIMRNILYQSKVVSKTMKKGENYDEFPYIIQINFNKFSIFNDNKVVNKCMLMETETHEIETENFIRYHINIEEAKRKWYNDKEVSRLEKMITLLDLDDRDLAKKLVGDDTIMEKAYDELDKMSNDDDLYIEWDYVEDARRENEAIMRQDRKEARAAGKEEGRIEGILEGKLEGIAEGKLEGIAEGKLEGKLEGRNEAIIEIAKNLIASGIDLDVIAKNTGLSIEVLKEMSL